MYVCHFMFIISLTVTGRLIIIASVCREGCNFIAVNDII